MIHLVGLLIAGVTCADIAEKLDRVRNHPDLTPQQRIEVAEIYSVHLVETMGLACTWDAND